ncbi:MAG: 28S ribosomal protein S25, mitochondrial, variant 2 [Marteilia pararefringens]
MPFAIGKYAWRRNEAVLRSNALILKDSIAALLFRVPGDLRTKACLGLKEFIAVHYDSLLYWNKDKHITFANDKIKYGHIKLVYKDQNNDIKVSQIGTCNKSSVDILELMKRSLIKTEIAYTMNWLEEISKELVCA